MITVEQIDVHSRRQVARFVELPYRLYRGCEQWCPPLRSDVRTCLNPQRHPFYEHSQADFFVAVEKGRDVGRIAVLEHCLFNAAHEVRQAHLYFFDCEDNQAAANALFTRASEWAAGRNLTTLLGPKGFSVLDGFGVLIDGFQRRQMMSLNNYNYPYYGGLFERAGFVKYVDLISCYLDKSTFRPPAWLDEVAAWAERESGLQVSGFANMGELYQAGAGILNLYNEALAQNWEYYPFSPGEVKFVVDTIKPVCNPQLMKVVKHGNEMVGVFLVFPDITPALQRARGRLHPLSIADILLAVRRRPAAIAIGGLAVMPEYRLRGGNALLFAELIKTVVKLDVHGAELLQIPETAKEMRRDLAALGIQPSKTHRVYSKQL